MDLLRRLHRRDRACPDPACAPIIVGPFHPVFALVPLVRFWHLADIPVALANVCFWHKADIP
jgi:hypothetical protein